MKTARSLIHIIAISACFAAYIASHGEIRGVRRAMQTIAATVELPAAQAENSDLVAPDA